MKLSQLSIERPVLATVLNLLIVVAGVVGFTQLPVREYPDVDFPVVSVSTVYPGASPLTVEATVTEPLEQAINGIEDIRSVTSTSSFSVSNINVEFQVGRDIDQAATDVSNAIQTALGELPPEAERPVVRKAGAETRPIIWLSLVSDQYSPEDRTDIAERVVRTPLQLLPGVAQVIVGGSRRYAMRVWLDPDRMAARGVDASDVRRAILENNVQAPAGVIEGEGRKFTLNIDAQIDDPSVYERLVIREDGERPVRIADVGWVELGSENYQTITRVNGEPTTGVGIVRQSKANQLEVSAAIKSKLPEIRAALPPGIELVQSVDSTIFIEASLAQVRGTLGIVFLLVVIVNLFFLRSVTTTTITAIAIPISLVGTFAVMGLFGFSINVLTMLALVLAIGLLVDDSIVVLENIYRRQERGEAPLSAALRGAREVGFPVIATTLAVIAVLVPLSLIPGNTGRLFREFALTMAIAVSISTFVALTAVPMLCSRFLALSQKHGVLWRSIESFLGALAAIYDRVLAWSLRRRWLVGVLLVVTIVASVLLLDVVPTTLAPVEDRGEIFTVITTPQGSTAAYTDRVLREVEEIYLSVPQIDGFFAAIGLGIGGAPDTSNGVVFVRLEPWGERDVKQQEIVASLFPQFMAIPEGLVFPINPPSLGQSGRQADIQIILKSSAASLEDFQQVTQRLVERLRQVDGLVNVDTDARLESPQVDVVVDRERAADIGVSVGKVAEALRLLVSQGRADDFILRNKQYDVVMSLSSRYRSLPEQLGEIHIRAGDGSMVPLGSVTRAVPRIGPANLAHYDLERSASVNANLAPGAALGDRLPEVLRIVDEELPEGFSTAFGGVAREFVESSGAIYLTFLVSLLVVYLVLAAQFESFVHPLSVMLTVPLAALGALGALWLTGNSLNIYSGIGMILLLGLVTKNAILLVDFANQERARGGRLLASLKKAGHNRFRPILMTSVTSILGAVPLAWAAGAGAESRRAIGAVVVGGLLFSTVFTLVVIPTVHFAVIRIAERLGLRTIPPEISLD